MRLATYRHPRHGNEPVVGVVQGDRVLHAGRLLGVKGLLDMTALLDRGREALNRLREEAGSFAEGRQASSKVETNIAAPLWEVQLLAPVPRPRSLRDFYAFKEHAATAHRKRGREVPKAWYEVPVFYFGHAGSVYGPDADVPKPTGTAQLDFELEIACLIGTRGKNIPATEAWDHVAGFTVMNDWSARDVQRQEMSVGLGPAKGKDFATSLGPFLVTLDELADRFDGERHDLTMVARVNGEEVTRGNAKSIHWTFAQMIERASLDVELLPGDVIGSGTVGGGCILELGEDVHPWLEPGDELELEVERLGRLRSLVAGSI